MTDRFVDAHALDGVTIAIALMASDGSAKVDSMQISFREASVLIGCLQSALSHADEKYRRERLAWVRENYPQAMIDEPPCDIPFSGLIGTHRVRKP